MEGIKNDYLSCTKRSHVSLYAGLVMIGKWTIARAKVYHHDGDRINTQSLKEDGKARGISTYYNTPKQLSYHSL